MSQREFGIDTTSYRIALRAAQRQDPDVILIGEMRDHETVDIALKATETGHLVFSTLHTTDAVKTIERMVAIFPADEQESVRLRIASHLRGTIGQRLVPRIDNNGRALGGNTDCSRVYQRPSAIG